MWTYEIFEVRNVYLQYSDVFSCLYSRARSKLGLIVWRRAKIPCAREFISPCSFFRARKRERGNGRRRLLGDFASSACSEARGEFRVAQFRVSHCRDALNILVRCAGNDLITIRLRDASLARFVARLRARNGSGINPRRNGDDARVTRETGDRRGNGERALRICAVLRRSSWLSVEKSFRGFFRGKLQSCKRTGDSSLSHWRANDNFF